MMHRQSEVCKDCIDPKWAENNPNWKGGKITHSSGYIYIQVWRDGKPKYMLEHIVVMETKLGRRMLPGENIHHINGIKDDNRIENLELWIRPQPTGIRAKDAVEWAKQIIELYGDL